jgi:PAS domain S-box-containing protein
VGPLITANIIVCGICLSLAFLHLAIYIRRTELKAYLFFAVISFCMAGSSFFETEMYHAVTSNAFLSAFKNQVTCQGILWIGFAWFVAFYTGLARRWLAATVTGLYVVAVFINLLSPHGVIYSGIENFYQITLPWGEHISYANGPANPSRVIPDIAWFLLIYLTVESLIRMGRKGQQRRAIYLGVVFFVFIGLEYLHGTLIDFGIMAPPSFFSFSFLGLILIMSATLVSEVVRASQLSREVESNERRWRTLLEKVKLLVAGLDRDGNINYVNPHFCEISGYQANEILGKNFTYLIPEKNRPTLLNTFNAGMTGDLTSQIQASLLTKAGKMRQIVWSNALLYDAIDQISGILSIGEDITQLILSKEQLVDEKERTDIILSSLNTGLVLLDPEMTVTWANAKIREMFPDENLVGRKCYAVAENSTTPCEGCQAVLTFTDGEVHEREFLNLHNKRWYQVIALPVKDDTGKVVSVLEASTDIDERKRTEEARDEALKELKTLKNRLEEENIYLKTEIRDARLFTNIIGKSNTLVYVLSRVKEVAQSDVTVMVQGETGTGKELISLAIHEKSKRAEKPFIKVNCAALPSSLVESELFGHERGAFTGAEKLRKGRFELADGGTLFLDEISELPLENQSKLLRVLQDGQFERVGGTPTLKVDVRVICATNHDLNEEVAKGRFRPDLFYRLNVYPITVPPLRKRREDIPLLVEHFIPQIASRIGKHIDQITPQMMEVLMAYDWPGNVRELRNVLERAIITSTDSVLRLPSEFFQTTVKQLEKVDDMENPSTLEDVERNHILTVLRTTDWRISGPNGAAKMLGLNPSTLRSRLKKLGIQRT